MPDLKHLDSKYFIDSHTYNCPFCNRNHVSYLIDDYFVFDWTDNKKCYSFYVICKSCEKISLHHSFSDINVKQGGWRNVGAGNKQYFKFGDGEDIDSKIFHSIPTSFFTLDERIPKIIRELITEAEGSIKMNFLTGASACLRKSIYELLVKENVHGDNYTDKIKNIKIKYPDIDDDLIGILTQIKDMTSEKVHEQSWDKWDSKNLQLLLETVKAILTEIYIIPDEKRNTTKRILGIKQEIEKSKKK